MSDNRRSTGIVADKKSWLKGFREVNSMRRASAPLYRNSRAWSDAEWGCALAGEVGELCNLFKKEARGQPIERQDVADELADIFTYLDAIAASWSLDLAEIVTKKFNEVSQRAGVNFAAKLLTEKEFLEQE